MRYFAMLAFLIFVVPLSLFGTTHEEEQTLSIIKPDGVTNQHIGDVLNRFEKSGLKIVGLKMIRLSPDQAQKFSEIHKDYPELIQYLNSGPIVAIVLQGPDAAAKTKN